MKNTPTKTKTVCVKVPVEYILSFAECSAGDSFSDFVREAIRNELSRRFNVNLKTPVIRKGVRYDLHSSDKKKREAALDALKEAAKEARERKKIYREKQLLVVNALLRFVDAFPPALKENAPIADFRATLKRELKRKKMNVFELLLLFRSQLDAAGTWKKIDKDAAEIIGSVYPYGKEFAFTCLSGESTETVEVLACYSIGKDEEKIVEFIEKKTELLKKQ